MHGHRVRKAGFRPARLISIGVEQCKFRRPFRRFRRCVTMLSFYSLNRIFG
jgi:hypothetical protein